MVRAGLAPAVSGAAIAGVSVLDERALTRHDGDGAHFEATLTGRTIRSAARRGKFLWLPLEAAAGGEPVDAIIGHLGMSGQLLLRPPGAPPERHERVRRAPRPPAARRARADLRRSADVRLARPRHARDDDGCRARRARNRRSRRCRARWRTSRATRSTPPSTTTASGACSPSRTRRSSASCWIRPWRAASATSTPTKRSGPRGCIPRRAPGISPPARPADCCRGACHPHQVARRGRHQLRRPIRQRQRPGRLLRALPERVRPDGRAVRALRPPDRARVIHEPVESLLSALSAVAAASGLSTFFHAPA